MPNVSPACRAGLAVLAMTVVSAQPASAQQTAPFFDGRRLPDLEVERRNQDVQQEQRRQQDADAKKLAAEQRLAAEAARQTAARTAALAPSAVPVVPEPTAPRPGPSAPSVGGSTGACEAPKITVEPLTGGRLKAMIDSPCRRGQVVTMTYGDLPRAVQLDAATGKASVFLDLYLGDGQDFVLSTADGKTEAIPAVSAKDQRAYSKLALIWKMPVDLNLHAIENNAQIGAAGHIHAGAPRTAEDALALATSTEVGAGFMSSLSTGKLGDVHVEVYTFFHHSEQSTGAVPLAIEHATRGQTATGETCGQGALAEIAYEAVLLSKTGDVVREDGVIPSVACGTVLLDRVRFIRGAVPDIRFRR